MKNLLDLMYHHGVGHNQCALCDLVSVEEYKLCCAYFGLSTEDSVDNWVKFGRSVAVVAYEVLSTGLITHLRCMGLYAYRMGGKYDKYFTEQINGWPEELIPDGLL